MRRRSVDHLVPNEQRTLRAALELREEGTAVFHGYQLARQVRGQPRADRPMAYSTVYRCIERLVERELFAVVDDVTTPSGGPARRHLTLTERGASAAAEIPRTPDGFEI